MPLFIFQLLVHKKNHFYFNFPKVKFWTSILVILWEEKLCHRWKPQLQRRRYTHTMIQSFKNWDRKIIPQFKYHKNFYNLTIFFPFTKQNKTKSKENTSLFACIMFSKDQLQILIKFIFAYSTGYRIYI